MDYATLIAGSTTPGSVSRWLNNSTITGDMPEIVLEAESWIYRRLRHFQMIASPVTGTLTIGNDYLTVPSDFLEPITLMTTKSYAQFLDQKPMQEVLASWSWDGSGNRVRQQPMIYYFDGTAFRFDSPPDQAYAYALLYYQQPQPLSVSNTNFLTATYPRLLRSALMAAACEWSKDNGQGNYDRTYWDEMAQAELEAAQIESDRAKRGTIAGMVLTGGGGYNNWPFSTVGGV